MTRRQELAVVRLLALFPAGGAEQPQCNVLLAAQALLDTLDDPLTRRWVIDGLRLQENDRARP